MKLGSPVGENELRWHLTNLRPVMVMLGVEGFQFWKWRLPAGHWMVAYGFDSDFIYLTNFGQMSWTDFRLGWRSLVPRLISMGQRGLGLAA